MKSALELGRDIATSRIDPVELTQATLYKAHQHPSRDHIFARLTEDRALEEATAARKRQISGDLQSPLDGVPISWKDLFDTKGIATESGSQLLYGRVPDKDAIALSNATKAGLVCIGKTHLSELAFSGLGINPKTATSPNIHGKHLAPGGSSSGAAASVAHEIVPIGIGSDTGGSVRIPSAWNDLVGFKTTHGMISGEGIVPLCASFDTAGPLCNSVADAWAITSIMAGFTAEIPEEKPIELCRFLVNETIMLDDLDAEQREAFESAVEALLSAGATVDYSPITECEETLPLGPILFPYEAWEQWGETIDANPGVMFDPVESRFRSGVGITQNQMDTARAQLMVLRETYNKRTEDYDAVLAPTVAIGPPEIKPLLDDYDLFSDTNMKALRNTRFFNMLGNCALALPTSRPAASLMVAAQGGKDRHLASIGLAIEAIVKFG